MRRDSLRKMYLVFPPNRVAPLKTVCVCVCMHVLGFGVCILKLILPLGWINKSKDK